MTAWLEQIAGLERQAAGVSAAPLAPFAAKLQKAKEEREDIVHWMREYSKTPTISEVCEEFGIDIDRAYRAMTILQQSKRIDPMPCHPRRWRVR